MKNAPLSKKCIFVCNYYAVLFQKLGRDSVAGNECAGKRAVVYRSAAAGWAVRLEYGSFYAEVPRKTERCPSAFFKLLGHIRSGF